MVEKAPFGRDEMRNNAYVVFRVRKLEAVTFRILSNDMDGVLVHFYKKNPRQKKQHGEYCRYRHKKGDCPHCSPNKQWRGYISVLLHNTVDDKWYPACLELTQSAEHQMRGRWSRGDVWKASRPSVAGKEEPPLVMELWERRGENGAPTEINNMSALQRLYQQTEPMLIDERNPVPPPHRVCPFEQEPPVKRRRRQLVEEADRPLTADEIHAKLAAAPGYKPGAAEKPAETDVR